MGPTDFKEVKLFFSGVTGILRLGFGIIGYDSERKAVGVTILSVRLASQG